MANMYMNKLSKEITFIKEGIIFINNSKMNFNLLAFLIILRILTILNVRKIKIYFPKVFYMFK